MKSKLLAVAILSSLACAVQAQQAGAPIEKRELIYCADRMTHDEREAYRARMQAARTFEEKTKIRADHQADMQARAVSQGVAGQCEPRQGQGPGAGQGYGPGQGQGGGRR